MTMYLCKCGDVHDSAVQAPCPTVIAIELPVAEWPRTSDAKRVGAEIRRLLKSLRHQDDDCGPGGGWNHNGTDALRTEALRYAGICSLANGELAPSCGCGWTADGGIVRPTKENPYP